MEDQHAFLWEIIIDSLTIFPRKKKEKSVGFGETNEKRDPNSELDWETPLTVSIKFYEFPRVELNEDQRSAMPEKSDKSMKSDKSIVKSVKSERSVKSEKSLKSLESPESLASVDVRNFSRGRTALFRTQPTKLLESIKSTGLDVLIFREYRFIDEIGFVNVPFDESFVKAIEAAAEACALRKLIREKGPLFPPMEEYVVDDIQSFNAERMLRPGNCDDYAQEEKELMIRFGDFMISPPVPDPCPYCRPGEPCPLPADTRSPPAPSARTSNITKNLLKPSPSPLTPHLLPTSATQEASYQIIDQQNKITGIIKLWVRLTCFGDSLQLSR